MEKATTTDRILCRRRARINMLLTYARVAKMLQWLGRL